MSNTSTDQSAHMNGDPMEGMTHSEVHYFNSYNHHGIHEEMLVGSSDQEPDRETKMGLLTEIGCYRKMKFELAHTVTPFTTIGTFSRTRWCWMSDAVPPF